MLEGRKVILGWCAAGLALPLLLGGGSWLAYQAGWGFLSEGLGGPFFFATPFAPFAARELFAARGAAALAPGVLAAGLNVALYAFDGWLYLRWRGLLKVDRYLRLVASVGALHFLLLAVASVVAFSH
jgi:hypothetical protein